MWSMASMKNMKHLKNVVCCAERSLRAVSSIRIRSHFGSRRRTCANVEHGLFEKHESLKNRVLSKTLASGSLQRSHPYPFRFETKDVR